MDGEEGCCPRAERKRKETGNGRGGERHRRAYCLYCGVVFALYSSTMDWEGTMTMMLDVRLKYWLSALTTILGEQYGFVSSFVHNPCRMMQQHNTTQRQEL